MINKQTVWLLLLALLLVACGQDDGADGSLPNDITDGMAGETAVSPVDDLPVVTQTHTPEPPTPTPEPPLAARVNGQPILLETYERELVRHEQALAELGLERDAQVYREEVLQALIERVLIVQAAAAAGVDITPEMVTAKVEELRQTETAGEAGNFEAWLEANHWTESEFRDALHQEMITEAMVTAVTADVPQTVEQVRARYIQVDSATLAQTLLAELEAGANFTTLASLHSLDQITAPNGGDLDFFARGSLLVPEVEEAAFALEPGQTSDIITAASNGQTVYYLVQTIERDPQRPLTESMRYNLLQQRFETWLAQLWSEAEIERFVSANNA